MINDYELVWIDLFELIYFHYLGERMKTAYNIVHKLIFRNSPR